MDGFAPMAPGKLPAGLSWRPASVTGNGNQAENEHPWMSAPGLNQLIPKPWFWSFGMQVTQGVWE